MIDGVNYKSATDNDLDGGANPQDPEVGEDDTVIDEFEEEIEYVEGGPNEDIS